MKKLQHLIAKDIFNCLTTAEQEELQTLRKQYGISEEAYEKMKLTICGQELHEKIATPPVRKHYLRKFIRYAAIFVIPLSVASYFLLKNTHIPTVHTPVANQITFNEKPQPKEIQLILANGETVQLARENKDVIVAPNILNTGKMLKYQNDTTISPEMAPSFNRVVVPSGGEFNIRLSDGTQIWLNEKTQLKYPVEFNQAKREIYLQEGEIYLEVAKDSLHPFIVHTSNGKVEVLGTHFNIRCIFSNCIETTLAEGKVKISRDNKEVILQPGQQARVTDEISVAKVDVEEVICWKDNLFYFKDTPLETILNKLAGWYDFEIEWQNPDLKTKKFFMSIDKYASVREILNILSEVSEVRFNINGKKVNVSK